MAEYCFVGLKKNSKDKTFLYRDKDLKTAERQVLWGDRLQLDGDAGDGWLRIIWSPKKDPKTLFIPKADTETTRPLEMIFVDVGQGDGMVLFTPERDGNERVMVVDAGKGGDMAQFLGGRFKGVLDRFDFHAAIITHPDKDHYLGFEQIFSNPRFGFKTVYHSGLVERPVSGTFEKLGGKTTDAASGIEYLADLAVDDAVITANFSNPASFKKFEYPPVIHAAINNPAIPKFRMLSTAHGDEKDGRRYLFGFAPGGGRDYSIEILGPVVEPDAVGKPRLRVLGNYGETKNGHSVLLRLTYGSFSVLFGGDLNTRAEQMLLAHYGDRQDLLATKDGTRKLPKKGTEEYQLLIAAARKRLRSEVMKSSHHGATDVTDAFIEAVDPASFIISSGDQEGYVHPRPDLLGRLGKLGRGEAPVLLSTELQRSTRPSEDAVAVQFLRVAIEEYRADPSAAKKKAMDDSIDMLARDNIDVYGAIYLKTDGKRLITAVKYESPSLLERWFYYEYVFNAQGELRLVS